MNPVRSNQSGEGPGNGASHGCGRPGSAGVSPATDQRSGAEGPIDCPCERDARVPKGHADPRTRRSRESGINRLGDWRRERVRAGLPKRGERGSGLDGEHLAGRVRSRSGEKVVIRHRPPSWNQTSDPRVALICSHRERSRTNRTRAPCRGWWFAPFHNRYTRISDRTGPREVLHMQRLPVGTVFPSPASRYSRPPTTPRSSAGAPGVTARKFDGLLLPLRRKQSSRRPRRGDGQERASEE